MDGYQSRGQVCGKCRLNWEPFLCASALPELHVPFTSQSHNLESQPFDELHEFVTGLSVIRTKPVSAPPFFSFFSPAPLSSFQLLLERWGDRPPTSDMRILVRRCMWKISAKNNAMESATGRFKEGGNGLPCGSWGWKKKLKSHWQKRLQT